MTRAKKTRSMADKVTIRTGRRKDYRKWRHENPDQVASSQRYTDKKRQQRKLQAERKLARQRSAPTLDVHGQQSGENTGETGGDNDNGAT